MNTNGVAGGTTTNYVQSTQYYPHGAPQYLQYASNLWWDQSFSKTLQSQEAWSAKNNDPNTWMYNLNVKPIFIMTTSLQESGWDLAHVFGKNRLSHGLPLNNLFGITQAGGDNIPYPSPDASAADWERVCGPQLRNNPPTIEAYVQDLLKVPTHRYNDNPGYAKQMYATYSTLARTVNSCGTTFSF